MYLGLPVPIVAIAAGISNDHYGSENGLVYIIMHVLYILCMYIHTYITMY